MSISARRLGVYRCGWGLPLPAVRSSLIIYKSYAPQWNPLGTLYHSALSQQLPRRPPPVTPLTNAKQAILYLLANKEVTPFDVLDFIMILWVVS